MYADDDEDDDEGDEEDDEDDEEEDDEEEDDEEEDEEEAPAKPTKPTKPAAAAAAPKAAAPAVAQAGKRAREDERAPADAKKDAKKVKEQAAPPAPSPAAAGMSPAAGGAFVAVPSSSGKVMMKETRVGGGAVARPGQKVTVAYVGSLKNGTVFDRSKNFAFKLGKGEVIRGWDLGVAGMRVGGSRELIIHADFAYGSKGSPPTIPPGATLKFSVDLVRA
jgi:FK506-binding nuclear protein